MKKQQNIIEKKLIDFFGAVFGAPMNMGLVAVSAAFWLFLFSFAYDDNGNLDLFLNVMHYVILTSIACILVGKLGPSGKGSRIVNLSIISLLLGVFGIISFKVYALSLIGYFVVCPASFFTFALLLKALWEDL